MARNVRQEPGVTLLTERMGFVPATGPARVVGDLAWLAEATNSSDEMDPNHHKGELAIQALDTVFARYGR